MCNASVCLYWFTVRMGKSSLNIFFKSLRGEGLQKKSENHWAKRGLICVYDDKHVQFSHIH